MTPDSELQQVGLVPPGVWVVDPDRSAVAFEIRHLKFTRVRGRFHEMTAVVRGGEDGNASITGSIGVASVDTGDTRRDARLRAHDFFDVEHHPTISFTGDGPPAGSPDRLTVNGTLTIRGVSRPLELRVSEAGAADANGGRELRLHAVGGVSRREFGLEWDGAFAAGGLVIDDRVGLRLDVALVPDGPAS